MKAANSPRRRRSMPAAVVALPRYPDFHLELVAHAIRQIEAALDLRSAGLHREENLQVAIAWLATGKRNVDAAATALQWVRQGGAQ